MRWLTPIFFYSIAAHGVDFTCFANFTNLAADEPRALAMMTTTYEAFLELPTEAGAKTHLVDVLLKGTDPLVLSDGATELATVRKKLAEFQRMLAHLGWDTPENKARLTDLLRRRRDGVETVAATLPDRLKHTEMDRVFPFKKNIYVAVIPGGPLVVNGLDRFGGPTGQYELRVLNTQTGETRKYFSQRRSGNAPVANSDGTKLVFTDHPAMMVFTVGQNGENVQMVRIGARHLTEHLTETGRERSRFARIHALKNPDWMLVQHSGRQGLYLYDLEKQTFHHLGGSNATGYGLPGGGAQVRWGIEEGTNTVLLESVQRNKNVLQSAEINEKGKLGPWKEIKSWPYQVKVSFSGNGLLASRDYAILHQIPEHGESTVLELKTGKTFDLNKVLPPWTPMTGGRDYKMHPNGKELMVTQYMNNEVTVHVVDLSTGTLSGSFVVRGTSVIYSGDGETMLALFPHQVRVMHYRARLGSP